MESIPIRTLMRPNISSLVPYSSARNEFAGEGHIFLDANESYNSFVSGAKRNRYPDPNHQKLKEKLASHLQVDQQHIVIGNGSDELIDLLFRIFCEPQKDKALLISPTYGAYQVFADINNVDVSHCQLGDDYTINLRKMEAVCELVGKGTVEMGMHKLLFICSPNNPTGNAFPLEQLEVIIKKFKGITVIDEAYIEYSDKESVISLLQENERLVILRTFSKAWALADVRVGYALAHPAVIRAMHQVKYPYNLSGVAQELAIEALEKKDEVYQAIQETKKERSRVASELKNLSFVERVFPSDANFLLLRMIDPDGIYEQLKERGIIVRNRSFQRGCYGCIRITIGSKEENDALLEALKEMENAT
ncbi:MAG: histidinol-phosphate transaminase [Sphaerochaetaceae bacterium]|jgi:histidinol-phosphate aminotransferase